MSSPRTFRIRKPSQLTLALAGSAVAVAAIASAATAAAMAGPAGTPRAPHGADAPAGSARVAAQSGAAQPGAAQPGAAQPAAGQAGPAGPPSLFRPAGGGLALSANAAARLPAVPRQIARGMMPGFHWSVGKQFKYLNWLWTRESSWNRYAANPYTGAYGIPQAVPGSKMASAGSHWRSNAATQIRWGLGYIHRRYGSPRRAWDHELAYGWY